MAESQGADFGCLQNNEPKTILPRLRSSGPNPKIFRINYA